MSDPIDLMKPDKPVPPPSKDFWDELRQVAQESGVTFSPHFSRRGCGHADLMKFLNWDAMRFPPSGKMMIVKPR